MVTDADKSEECDFCGFVTDELQAFDHRGGTSVRLGGETMWLCDLCASTPASSAHEFPAHYKGEVAIMKTICYVGNVLLAAIEEAARG